MSEEKTKRRLYRWLPLVVAIVVVNAGWKANEWRKWQAESAAYFDFSGEGCHGPIISPDEIFVLPDDPIVSPDDPVMLPDLIPSF